MREKERETHTEHARTYALARARTRWHAPVRDCARERETVAEFCSVFCMYLFSRTLSILLGFLHLSFITNSVVYSSQGRYHSHATHSTRRSVIGTQMHHEIPAVVGIGMKISFFRGNSRILFGCLHLSFITNSLVQLSQTRYYPPIQTLAGFSSVVYISLLSSTLSCNYHKLDIIHEIKFLQYRQLSRAIITNLISFHNLKILQDPLRLCASDIHHELYRVIITNSISSTIANINRFLFGCVHRPRSFLEIGFRPQYPSFV